VFELAWALLSLRRYEDCADAFMELTQMNNWSYATYCFIAAGCYVSAGMLDEAQEIVDELPDSINRRKRSVPTEVYIKKKLEFYQKKQIRRGGDPKRYVEAIKISPAEEFAIFWNTHSHIDKDTALAHIKDLSTLTPPVGIESEYMPAQPAPPADAILDLDTADELAIRSLILGIVHRTIGDYATSRMLLNDALKHFANVEISNWVGTVTWFERSVLELKDGEKKAAEAEAQYFDTAETEEEELKAQEKIYEIWQRTFDLGRRALSRSHALCTRDTDLAARLDSRIIMLKDEMKAKMATLGLEI